MSAIYVWIETFNGEAQIGSWEALSAGRQLADQFDVPLTALVFGEQASAAAEQTAHHGATAALVCEDATLTEYRLEPYAALLTRLVQDNAPRIVLASATSRGRELLAAAAADTDSPMLPDIITLESEADGTLRATHPAFAGKVLSTLHADTEGTVFITTRGRAFPATPTHAGDIAISTVGAALSEDDIATKVEDFQVATGSVSLTDASIIVSGGRGMDTNPNTPPDDVEDAKVWKAKNGFENTLQPLADALGAAVGASRAAVDAGYIDYAHQVGQTGKNVAPDLYIACGISGAIQHQAGMRGSKIIVAINNDPDAPIFKLARYGLAGNLYEIVPALTAEIIKHKG